MNHQRLKINTFPLILIILTWFSGSAKTVTETLNYVISYKWGLIQKDAGDATLTMSSQGNKTDLTLTAKTRPWADKFFMVRDTLHSQTTGRDFLPEKYIKSAHEGGAYSRDEISFSRNQNSTVAECHKLRINKKGEKRESDFKLKGGGNVFDMLSVFYYLRNADYLSLQQGNPLTVTIFSGSDKSENVRIRFVKEEIIEMKDKKRRKAYLLKLGFTSDGHKKSNDDIRVWVSADGKHIPLLLIGSLPIGEVRVRLV